MTAIRENGATSGAGVLATYSYDGLGRRTGIVRGNGTVTNYAYDGVSRLSSLGHDLAGPGNDATTVLSYAPSGQIASATRDNDAYARTGAANASVASTANGLNQLASVGGATPTHDALGNLTGIGGTSYIYSQRSELAAGPGVALFYDPAGRLDLTHTGTSGTAYGYAGADLTGEYAYGTGALLKRYVHGPGTNEPLVEYDASGNRTWLHADERGSIVARTNASGTVTAINSYDEYGVPAASNVGRFGYTGQTWLPELGLSYYKARMYAPQLGRFMQADPIGYEGASMNLYGYVGGDPVNSIDPSGLATITCNANSTNCRDENGNRVDPTTPLGPGDSVKLRGTNKSVYLDKDGNWLSDVVVIAERSAGELISINHENVYYHYNYGDGVPIQLTDEQFLSISKSYALVAASTKTKPSKTGAYAQQTNLYGKSYGYIFGKALGIFNKSRRLIGFHDTWNLDSQSKERSFFERVSDSSWVHDVRYNDVRWKKVI